MGYINKPHFSACGLCGGPSPLHNDLSGKQICSSCTSINFANANTCSVCGQALNHKIIQKDDDGNLIQKQLKMDMDIDQTHDNAAINNKIPQYPNNNNFHYPPQPPSSLFQPPPPQP